MGSLRQSDSATVCTSLGVVVHIHLPDPTFLREGELANIEHANHRTSWLARTRIPSVQI